MEYSRKVGLVDGAGAPAGSGDTRVMDFGSVFLVNPAKDGDDATTGAGTQSTGVNIAELLVARGFATVVRHRDFEERSNYYDGLLSAESRAISGKKGVHSAKDPPVRHVTDLLTVSSTPYMINIVLCIYKLLCSLTKCMFLIVELNICRLMQRKQKTSCHSCNVIEGCLLLSNMFSVDIDIK